MDSICGSASTERISGRSGWLLDALFVGVLVGPLTAAESAPDGLITTLDDGRVLVAGALVVDRTARSVTLPAVVNQHHGLIEYLLVHSTGKRHEALFTTSVRPQHLHLACLLVGAPGTDVPSSAGAAVTINVVWQGHGPAVRFPAEQLLVPATHDGEALAASMTAPEWNYGGSTFINEGFAAEVHGSCIALQADPAALISAPGLRAGEFIPAASRLPTVGAPVSIVLIFRDVVPTVVQPVVLADPGRPS